MKPLQVYKQTKYTSRNPLVQYLNNVYLRAILRLVRRARPSMLVDVGCGEGIVLRHLSEHHAVDGHMYGFDIDSTGLGVAQSQNTVRLIQGSIVSLPFADRSIDMVLCCEVLEHVEQPELALAELDRVAAQWLVLSVPNEPIWRMSNMARGKYLSAWGNTTGHINHWTRWGFLRLVRQRFDPVVIEHTLPFWSMLLARRRP